MFVKYKLAQLSLSCIRFIQFVDIFLYYIHSLTIMVDILVKYGVAKY